MSHHAGARRRRLRVCAAAAAGAALMGVTPAAAAQSRVVCPAMAGADPRLGAQDAAARLGYVQRRLRRGAARSAAWATVWSSAYALTAVGQLVRLGLSESRVHRWEAGIGAGSAALGAAFIAVLPPAIIRDSAQLNARVARMAPREACVVLAEAERYLVRDAANQAFGVGWLMQTVTVAYSVGLGLSFGLAFGDWTAGAITTFAGITASQLMNLTRPTDAVDALRRYRAGDLRPVPGPALSYWSAAPTVGPAGRLGASVRVVF